MGKKNVNAGMVGPLVVLFLFVLAAFTLEEMMFEKLKRSKAFFDQRIAQSDCADIAHEMNKLVEFYMSEVNGGKENRFGRREVTIKFQDGSVSVNVPMSVVS